VEVRIKTLTPLWTGDINRKCSKLKETGIIGSLRWWYEALIRGLGGYACDPSSTDQEYKKCELKQDKFHKALKEGKSIEKALDEQICPVCQLFGCTGWGKKVRIKIKNLDKNSFVPGKGEKAGLKPDIEFSFEIIENKTLRNEEKWLFKKLLWLIENFGAIGGRTTWKPNGKWCTSYGIIKVISYDGIENWDNFATSNAVKTWLIKNKEKLNKSNHPNWFNFKFYWIVKDYHLNREQLNKVVKRKKDNPSSYEERAEEFDRWLGGNVGISKKIFSFYYPKNNINKVFGYVRTEEKLEEIKNRIKEILGPSIIFVTGKQILEELK